MHSERSRHDYHVDVYSFKLLTKGLGVGSVIYKKDKNEGEKYPDYFVEAPKSQVLKKNKFSLKSSLNWSWARRLQLFKEVNFTGPAKAFKKAILKLMAVSIDALVIMLSLLFWFLGYGLVESYPNINEFNYQNAVLTIFDSIDFMGRLMVLALAAVVFITYRAIMLKAAGETFGQALLKRFVQNI